MIALLLYQLSYASTLDNGLNIAALRKRGELQTKGYTGCTWDLEDACEGGAVFWGAEVKLGISSVYPDPGYKKARRAAGFDLS